MGNETVQPQGEERTVVTVKYYPCSNDLTAEKQQQRVTKKHLM